MPPSHISLGPGLSPREAASDAIHRFIEGLDTSDAELVRSAFYDDSVIDTTGTGEALGRPGGQIDGLEQIENTILKLVGPLDSGHHLSNFRVKLNATMDEAEVTTNVLAQHFRAGQGRKGGVRHSFTMRNKYHSEVTKDRSASVELWRIKKIAISCMWTEGDVSVVYG